MKDREAWQAAVHELQRVGHDLVTKQYYSIVVQSLHIYIYVYIYVCICIYTHTQNVILFNHKVAPES